MDDEKVRQFKKEKALKIVELITKQAEMTAAFFADPDEMSRLKTGIELLANDLQIKVAVETPVPRSYRGRQSGIIRENGPELIIKPNRR